MRNIAFLFLLAGGLLGLVCCKTSEENYRQAYEKAKEKQLENLSTEELDGFARENTIPTTIVEGDTLPMVSLSLRLVKMTNDDNEAASNPELAPGVLKRYSVAVGAYGMLFTARSVVKRLRSQGYPDAVVAKTADDRYLALASSFPTLPEAAALYKKALDDDFPVRPVAPFPYLVCRL